MIRRAVIADDHPMCREATRIALAMVDPLVAQDTAASLADVRALAADADLLTLDLFLPDNRGILGLIELVRSFPDLPILVISGSEQPDIARQVRVAGARGFLSKAEPIATMIEAIRTVLTGGAWFDAASLSSEDDVADDIDDRIARIASLSPAERRVLLAMRDGRLNKQVAFDLGLSEITVKTHVKAILRKLDVVNRTQAALLIRDLEPAEAFAPDPKG